MQWGLTVNKHLKSKRYTIFGNSAKKFFLTFVKFLLDLKITLHCGGSESDKSQERTDLLSESTGLIYGAGKL